MADAAGIGLELHPALSTFCALHAFKGLLPQGTESQLMMQLLGEGQDEIEALRRLNLERLESKLVALLGVDYEFRPKGKKKRRGEIGKH